MLKALLILATVIVATGLIVVAVGYELPVSHSVAREAVYHQSPDRLFNALTEVEAFPRWRSDVTRIEVISKDPLRWREHGKNGSILFEVAERQPPVRLVTRIADTSLPFGGSWLYEFYPDGGDTRLRITERGEVYNPVFRLMSRFVFGHTATIDRCLADLQKLANHQ